MIDLTQTVCPLTDIDDGGWEILSVGERSVIVARVGDSAWVYINKCAHQALPLDGADGDGTQIRCPHHGVCFDLTDGRVVQDRGFYALQGLTPIPCSVRDGVVYIDEH